MRAASAIIDAWKRWQAGRNLARCLPPAASIVPERFFPSAWIEHVPFAQWLVGGAPAVQHDFESWRRKLSSRAIVLFHDTRVRERDFGVFRYWGEVSEGRPHFEFEHGYGLGVLGEGRAFASFPRRSFPLFAAAKHDATARAIRDAYAQRGAEFKAMMAP